MALTDIGARLVVEGLSGFTSGMKQAQDSTDNVTASVGRAGNAAGVFRTAATVAFAAVGAAAVAMAVVGVKAAGDLEQAVANISTIKPEINTQGVFNALNEMQTRVPQSAAQLGDALYNVFSSLDIGQDEALQLVETFAKAAVGAGTDAQTFGTAAIGVMNAYGLAASDAQHISDVFFNTVNLGVVTGQELAQNLGFVTQGAKLAGVSIDELGGFIAGVTKEGGPAAQNINNLNNLFLKITTKEAQAALHALDIATTTSTGEFRPLQDTFTDLKARMAGMSDSAKALALQKIFPDIQAKAGATVIMDQLDFVKSAIDANASSAGTTETAYAKMSATFNSQSKLMANALASVETSIGAQLLPVLTPLVSQFAQAIPAAFKLAGDALGPLLTDIGELSQIVFALATGQGFDKLYDGLNKVFGEEVAAAIASVVDPIAHFRTDELPQIITAFGEVWQSVQPVLATLGDLALQALPKVVGAIKGVVDAGITIVKFFKDNELAADALGAVLATVVIIQLGLTAVALYGVATAAVAAAIPLVALALPFIALGIVIAAVVLAAIEIVKHWSLVEAGAKSLEVILTTAWQNLQAIIGSAMAAIGTAVTTGWNTVTSAIGSAISTVSTLISTGWSNFTGVIGSAMATVGTLITVGWNNITGVVGSAIAAISTAVTTGWNTITTAIAGAWIAITGAVASAIATIQSDWNGLMGALDILKEHFAFILGFITGSVVKWVGDLIGLARSLSDQWTAVQAKLTSDLLSSIGNFIGSAYSAVTGWVSQAIGLAQSLTDQWNAVQAKLLSDLLTGIGTFIRDAFNAVSGWVTQALGLAQSLTDQWNAIQAQLLSDLLSGIGNFIGSAYGAVTGWVSQAVGLAQSLTDQWNAVQAQLLSGLLSGITTFVSDAFNAITGWVSQAVGLAQSLSDQWTAVQAALWSDALAMITGFGSDSANALGAQVEQWKQAAIDAVWGFIGGLTATIPSAISAVTNAAGQFVGGFKAALQIGSPSKVMADQVGKPMMEGIAQGITDGTPLVEAAISASVTDVTNAATSAMIDALGATKDQIAATIAGYTGTATYVPGDVGTISPVIDYNDASDAIIKAQEAAMYGPSGIIAQISALPGVATSRLVTSDLLPQIQKIIDSVNKATGQNFSLTATLHDLYFDGFGLDQALTDLWQGVGSYAVGGAIPGTPGTPVPILAHAGEIILNLSQQEGLAKAMAGLMHAGQVQTRPEVLMLPLGELARVVQPNQTTYQVNAHYSRWQDEADLKTDLAAIALLASR